jgi:hypothetical protein
LVTVPPGLIKGFQEPSEFPKEVVNVNLLNIGLATPLKNQPKKQANVDLNDAEHTSYQVEDDVREMQPVPANASPR